MFLIRCAKIDCGVSEQVSNVSNNISAPDALLLAVTQKYLSSVPDRDTHKWK